MDIETSAKDLGRLIAQSPEYKYYIAASREVDEDRETSDLMRKLKELEEKVGKLQQEGKPLDEQIKTEYTTLMENIQSKTMVQGLIASQENYLKLMNRVNAKIAEGIKEGAQSRIITNF
ncbi:MAG TPA: YlbF family regulator [Candidatus Glassbacteria bacterium]|nr:YlbF family regulator [Candidatus Glassbacteria bacterium]